jgi:hypothetical protein
MDAKEGWLSGRNIDGTAGSAHDGIVFCSEPAGEPTQRESALNAVLLMV